MVKALGLFVTEMNEIHEMLYQNEFPYLFDAAKFEKHFNFLTTDTRSQLALVCWAWLLLFRSLNMTNALIRQFFLLS